jgi:hypothetical protein
VLSRIVLEGLAFFLAPVWTIKQVGLNQQQMLDDLISLGKWYIITINYSSMMDIGNASLE